MSTDALVGFAFVAGAGVAVVVSAIADFVCWLIDRRIAHAQ